jgi:hypothetical protein
MHAVSLIPSYDACGVIDTEYTVHAVPLTPNARCITACVELRKVKIKCKTALLCKRLKMQSTDDSCGPGSRLKRISIKIIYIRGLSYPTTVKIYVFKWVI